MRPSALAVLRLITSSNLVGCLHRQFGGLFALEDATDIDAGLTEASVMSFCNSSNRRLRRRNATPPDRGDGVASPEVSQLDTPVSEE